jgi:glutamate synthase (ferredoxin)
MEHRGAFGGDSFSGGGDGVSGDGAGIMTQVPWKLLSEFRSESCPQTGVGMVFLPRDSTRRHAIQDMIQSVCERNELGFLGCREVPVDPSVLVELARAAQLSIWQFFV